MFSLSLLKSCQSNVKVPGAFCLLIALLLPGTASALLPFEKTGNIYVSMWQADEIAVFDPDGNPVERFSTPGLDGPRGIAFNPVNGQIWIAGEFSNAIFIFDHNHQFLRRLDHSDFDEPVGVTFSNTDGQEVFISNSNGNEIMVFDQTGNLLRSFTEPNLRDPNCSAFMQDGSFFVSNRLGGTQGSSGAVSKFGSNEDFLFDFTTAGISSLMAVARDPNTMAAGFDDTIWATSGAGDMGIYEFDQTGNLLTTLLPGNIGDGRSITPQGIAFDDTGSFYVASFQNEVIKFDGNGNFLMRFPTGSGTARSMAIQACEVTDTDSGCIPIGTTATSSEQTPEGTPSTGENTADMTDEGSTTTSDNLSGNTSSAGSSSGGGTPDLFLIGLLMLLVRPRCLHRQTT